MSLRSPTAHVVKYDRTRQAAAPWWSREPGLATVTLPVRVISALHVLILIGLILMGLTLIMGAAATVPATTRPGGAQVLVRSSRNPRWSELRVLARRSQGQVLVIFPPTTVSSTPLQRPG